MGEKEKLILPSLAMMAAMSPFQIAMTPRYQSTDPDGLNYIRPNEMNLTPVPFKDTYRKKANKPKSARKRKSMKRKEQK